jgi:uncharacterized protein (DUF362 family)
MDKKVFIDNVSDILKIKEGRRNFIKKLAFGSAGAAFASLTSSGFPEGTNVDHGQSVVSFVTGNDRRDMVYQSLKPLEKEIKQGIKGKQIIIKPNLVGNETLTAVAHPDAVRGVLDFLKPIYKQQVWIAESNGRKYNEMPGVIKHFHLYKYFPLVDEYGVKLVNLNAQSFTVQWVLGKEGHPLDIRVIDDFLNPDNYFISLCRPKSHNALVVTLTAKNMLLACPIVDAARHDKGRLHSPGIRKMNFDVFLLAQKVQPRLGVIDGLEGMEGNGPNNGTVVNHGFALASTDFIAADRVGCLLMGVDFGDVGYLTYCANGGIGQGDLSKIKIIGGDPSKHIIKYKMNDNFNGGNGLEGQLDWKS